MAKHDVLTQEEFDQYQPPARALKQLQRVLKARGLASNQLKVLDWGCGRGRFVLWLREQGYDAYGVDIDPEPIQNGLVLFGQKGYHDTPLTLFSAEGRTVYPDHSFDFIMTDNVLEHVRDFDKVLAEIDRLTRPGGCGYHIFPAQRQVVEGHLFMPFVHWLPAGHVRKALIRSFVRQGKHPRWEEVKDLDLEAKVEVYYRYSIDHIFYRPFRHILQAFQTLGFNVEVLSSSHPAIANHKILGPLSRFPLTRSMMKWLALTFRQVELFLEKPT